MSLNETQPEHHAEPEAPRCLICSSPVDAIDVCCSLDCTLAAEREVRRNVTALKAASGHGMTPEERLRLTQRNGTLSVALLNWRPDPRSE